MIPPPPRTQQSEWLNHITMRRVDELRVNVWLIRLAVAATKEVSCATSHDRTASDFRDPISEYRLPATSLRFALRWRQMVHGNQHKIVIPSTRPIHIESASRSPFSKGGAGTTQRNERDPGGGELHRDRRAGRVVLRGDDKHHKARASRYAMSASGT